MDDHEEDSIDDIERMESRVRMLSCQFDLSNIINDESDDDVYEEDYDSLTTYDADNLPHESDTFRLSPGSSDGSSLSPGTDFDLTERTSSIISRYRNYLTEMEVLNAKNKKRNDEAIVSSYRDFLKMEEIAVKNQSLADEMKSIRGALQCDLPTSAVVQHHSIEIHEEEPRHAEFSTKPIIHPYQLKKRLFKATAVVALMGTLAIFSFSAASSTSNREWTPPKPWDPELAHELEEDSESVNEAMMEEKASHMRYPASAATDHGAQWGRLSTEPPNVETNWASKFIHDTIAHPNIVQLTAKMNVDGIVDDNGDSSNVDEEDGVSMDVPKADDALSSSPHETSKEEIAEETNNMMAVSSKSAKSSGSKSAKSSAKTGKSTSKSKSGKASSVKSSSTTSKASKLVRKSNSSSSETIESVYSMSLSMSMSSSAPVANPSPSKEARAIQLHLEAANILYQATMSRHSPMFFGRAMGWEGESFKDAVEFCKSHYPIDSNGIGGVPCPYEVYCPEGPNNIPYGGYQSEATHIPIIDSREHWLGWVQLDSAHPCVTYTHLEPDADTQNIGCCKDISR